MADDNYMVWGGRHPGGWCDVWVRGMDLHRPHPQTGTKEQAEHTCAELRKDYPEHSYEVVIYDPEREPVSDEHKPFSEAQQAVLQCLADGRNPFNCYDPHYHVRRTISSVITRGLMMHDETRKPRLRLTRAGRRVLDREEPAK